MDFILSTLVFLGTLLLVILVFNLMILVHEWGHFLAARWRGLKVDKFQIWFGKPLWKKTINGVQYGLGSIPAGGFVALPQMAPMEMLEGSTSDGTDYKDLPPISALDKIIVAFAGPLFSFLLAVFFAFVVWGVGKPVAGIVETTEVGYVDPDMPAAKAGIRVGDKILEVDGEPVDSFNDMVSGITHRIILSRNEQIEFLVQRPGVPEPIKISVTPVVGETGSLERPGFRQIGIGYPTPSKIAKVFENSPAELAGIKAGDEIRSIDGREFRAGLASIDYIKANSDKELAIVLARGDETVEVRVKPSKPSQPEDAKPSLGIALDMRVQASTKEIHPSPYVQVKRGVTVIASTLGALFSPQSDVSVAHLSGPVGIGNLYYRLFHQPDGWKLVLSFSVMLNVNLAMLNLLPFPVLDGGHITLALISLFRKRPINPRVLEYFQAACALLLIGFMLFVTFYDVQDLGEGRGVGGGGGPPVWDPPAAPESRSPPGTGG